MDKQLRILLDAATRVGIKAGVKEGIKIGFNASSEGRNGDFDGTPDEYFELLYQKWLKEHP